MTLRNARDQQSADKATTSVRKDNARVPGREHTLAAIHSLALLALPMVQPPFHKKKNPTVAVVMQMPRLVLREVELPQLG